MAKNTNVPPPVSRFNRDEHATQVLAAFREIENKKRMEIVDQFNQSTFPSVIPNMRGKGSRKANSLNK
jgi:hypothetical protein